MTLQDWQEQAVESPILAQVLADWSAERVALNALVEHLEKQAAFQATQLDAIRALMK